MNIFDLYQQKELNIKEAMEIFDQMDESMPQDGRQGFDALAESLSLDMERGNNEEEVMFTSWSKAPNNIMMTRGYADLFGDNVVATWAAYLSIGLILGAAEIFGSTDGNTGYLQIFRRDGIEYLAICQSDGVVFLLPEEY